MTIRNRPDSFNSENPKMRYQVEVDSMYTSREVKSVESPAEQFNLQTEKWSAGTYHKIPTFCAEKSLKQMPMPDLENLHKLCEDAYPFESGDSTSISVTR
jgi:hypothetical protein